MNNTFDRVITNQLEKPVSDDLNREASEVDRTIRDLLWSMSLTHPAAGNVASNGRAPVTPAFMGDAFFVEPNGALTLKIRSGLGFMYLPTDTPTSIGGVTGLDDLAPYKPMVLLQDLTVNIDGGVAGGMERIDIIEVAPTRRRADSAVRGVFNTGTGVFDPTAVLKTLAWSLDDQEGQVVSPASSTAGISVKKGVPQVSGTYGATTYDQGVPTVTPGYTKIAQVLVDSSGTLTASSLVDSRKLWGPQGIIPIHLQALWTDGTPDTVVVSDNSALPPGIRVAAIPTGNNSPFQIFIVAGDPNLTIAGFSTEVVQQVLPHTTKALGLNVFKPDYGFLTSAEQASLAGLLPVGLGQKRLKLQIGWTNISGPVELVRSWSISAFIKPQ